jgi:hypothetical protein
MNAIEITQKNFTLVYHKSNIMAVLYEEDIEKLPATGYLKMYDEEMYYSEKYVLYSELDATDEYAWRMIPGTTGYAPICYFKVEGDFVPVTYLTDDFVNGDTIIYTDTSNMPVDFVALIGAEIYRVQKISRYSLEVIYPTYVTPPYDFLNNSMTYFSSASVSIHEHTQNTAEATWTIDFAYNQYFGLTITDFYGKELSATYTIVDNTTTFDVVFTSPQSGVLNVLTNHTWKTGCPVSVYAYSPAYEPFTTSGETEMPLQTISYNDDFGKYYKFKKQMFRYIPSIYKETDNYQHLNGFWDSVTTFYQGVYTDGDLLALIDYLECPDGWLPYLLRNLGWSTLTQNSEIWRWQARYLFPLLKLKGRVSSLKSTLRLLEVDFDYKEKWRSETSELIECLPEPDSNVNANYEVSLTTPVTLTLDDTTPYNKATIDQPLDIDIINYYLQDSRKQLIDLTSATPSGTETILTYNTAETIDGTATIATFRPFYFDDIVLELDYNDYKIYGKNLALTYPWAKDVFIAPNMPMIGVFTKYGDVLDTTISNLTLDSNFYVPIKPTATLQVTTATGGNIVAGSYRFGYMVMYASGGISELIQSATITAASNFSATLTVTANADWDKVMFFRTPNNSGAEFYRIMSTGTTVVPMIPKNETMVITATCNAAGDSSTVTEVDFKTGILGVHSTAASSYDTTYIPYFQLSQSDRLSPTHRILDYKPCDGKTVLFVAPEIDNDAWGDSLWEGSSATISSVDYTVTKSYKSSYYDTSQATGITTYEANNFSLTSRNGTYTITAENGLYKLVTDVSAYPVSMDVYVNGANTTYSFTAPSSASNIVTLSGVVNGLGIGKNAYVHIISKTNDSGTVDFNRYVKIDTTTATGNFSIDVEDANVYTLQCFVYPTQTNYYSFIIDGTPQPAPITVNTNTDKGVTITANVLTSAASGVISVVDASANPIENVDLVSELSHYNTDDVVGVFRTNTSGLANFTLNPGAYTFKAVKNGYKFTYPATTSSYVITTTGTMEATAGDTYTIGTTAATGTLTTTLSGTVAFFTVVGIPSVSGNLIRISGTGTATAGYDTISPSPTTITPLALTKTITSIGTTQTFVITATVDTSSYIVTGEILKDSVVLSSANMYNGSVIEISGSYIDVEPNTTIEFNNVYDGVLSFRSNQSAVYYCDIEDYWGMNKWKNGYFVDTSDSYTMIKNSYLNMVNLQKNYGTTSFSGSIYLKVPAEGDCLFVDKDGFYNRKWYGKLGGLTRIPVTINEPKQCLGVFSILGEVLYVNSIEQGIFKNISVFVNDVDLFASGTFGSLSKLHTSMSTTIDLISYLIAGENIIKVVLFPKYQGEYQVMQQVFVLEI